MSEKSGTNTALWRCRGCSTSLCGLALCHCNLCHRTFAGLDGFDAHLPGKCIDPTTLRWGKESKWAGKPRYVETRRTGQDYDYVAICSAQHNDA